MSSTALKAMKVTESTLNITQYLDTNTSPPVSLEHNSNNMIEIKGVCKRYGTNIILNNLSLTVPEGCIYGLLGSSGCGKTTLLNCLMGISDIEKGAIYVKHSKLSNIGLMPQDTALAPSLTTKEILYYFGKIYNMSDKNIQNRTEEVTTLLEIPSINTVISKLSGGQQRRVSFAVALLHDPKLLLLDEPTVGLDPVLSHHIWDYLIKITSQLNKTIIITTHYIEEAKQAHYVGLMRRGKLIEQGPPTSLMEKYNCSTLEETFLLLSKDDERSINTSSEAVRFNELDRVQEESCNSLSNSEFPPVQSPFSKRDRFSINRIRAQFHKNVLFITREVTFLGFIIFLPILICCIHNWALGGNPKDLTLAVVNSEDNCSNYHFYHGCHLNKSLSCRYLYHLEELKENFHLVHRDDFEEAKALTIDNKFWGLIYFPQNFSSYLIKRFERPFYNWTDDVLDLGTIEVHLDKTDVIISRFLIYSMQMKFTSFLEEIFKDCGWPATLGEYPIRFEDPVYGTRNPLFSQYQAPIMVTNFSFYLPMLVTITYIIHEKSSGFLQRSIASEHIPLFPC
ncbi:ABC transporter G family member 23-like isoform X2 [Lycorma delicatula]|uniref:ABC transporter G family member 23-like isoform X2 n=1 Tax=Lycorma delicatula TaxID=130591 RepID=UPI003F50E1C3